MAGSAGGFKYKVALNSISSLENLSVALGIKIDTLHEAVNMPQAERYERSEVPKSDGSVRTIYKPHHVIRLVQRRINRRIFSNPSVVAWPDHLYGSIPNHRNQFGEVVSRDYISCARCHCRSKSILKIDIKDFFDNVHSDLVFGVFRDLLKYSEEVSRALTSVCTFHDHLVQGALTSSYLANLCLHDVEGHVVDRLKRKGLVYTRFVDDITVSSSVSGYDFSYAKSIIEGMLTSKELPLNQNKTKIQYSSSKPLVAHGLRVCFAEPRLPSDEVRRIRAAVKNIEKIAAEDGYRMTHAYRHDFNRCMGRVNKLSRVGHNQHKKLVARLVNVYPLPSKKDIERAKTIIARLERDVALKRHGYWYSRRFYMAHERLNILKRSYPKTAGELRKKLRELVPTYE